MNVGRRAAQVPELGGRNIGSGQQAPRPADQRAVDRELSGQQVGSLHVAANADVIPQGRAGDVGQGVELPLNAGRRAREVPELRVGNARRGHQPPRAGHQRPVSRELRGRQRPGDRQPVGTKTRAFGAVAGNGQQTDARFKNARGVRAVEGERGSAHVAKSLLDQLRRVGLQSPVSWINREAFFCALLNLKHRSAEVAGQGPETLGRFEVCTRVVFIFQRTLCIAKRHAQCSGCQNPVKNTNDERVLQRSQRRVDVRPRHIVVARNDDVVSEESHLGQGELCTHNHAIVDVVGIRVPLFR